MKNFGTAVFQTAFSILRSKPAAEDVYQETFAALFQSFLAGKLFEDQKHLKSWLIRVSYNRAIDVTRSKAVATTAPTDPFSTVFTSIPASPDASTAFAISDELEAALTQLTDSQRALIYLRYFEGYSNKEIGAIAGMPAATVRTQLHRARKAIEAVYRQRKPTRSNSGPSHTQPDESQGREQR